MTIVCALLLSVMATALIYFTHPQQRLLHVTLPASARFVALIGLCLGTWLWCRASGMAAGFTSALTCVMCTGVALPYLGWWRGKRVAGVRANRS